MNKQWHEPKLEALYCYAIIRISSTSRLTVREQTPSGTVERVYTYEQLENDRYLMFNFL